LKPIEQYKEYLEHKRYSKKLNNMYSNVAETVDREMNLKSWSELTDSSFEISFNGNKKTRNIFLVNILRVISGAMGIRTPDLRAASATL